jgi:hypothetical protein
MTPEPQHNEALRKEIGYRLGVLLSREQDSTPERLLQLLRELGEVDHDPIGRNAFGPSSERIDGWLRALFAQQVQHLQERLQDEPNRYERDELERLLAKINDTLNSDLGTRPRT